MQILKNLKNFQKFSENLALFGASPSRKITGSKTYDSQKFYGISHVRIVRVVRQDPRGSVAYGTRNYENRFV